MLAHAIERVYVIAQNAGVYAMTLVANDPGVALFYEQIGFRQYAGDAERPKMLLPIQSIVELIEQNA